MCVAGRVCVIRQGPSRLALDYERLLIWICVFISICISMYIYVVGVVAL